jgi:glutamine cyclotransferase
MKILSILIFSLLLVGCNDTDTGEEDHVPPETIIPVPSLNYTLIHTYPHDTTSYTEGLLIHNGELYESTGSPDDMPQTKSLFGVLDTVTGHIVKKVEIDRKYFGEGICFLDGKLYQLTYQTKTGFIYDAKTFEKSGEFDFPGKEGWGLTTDSTSLIMSDGTNVLNYFDPADFRVVKTIRVTYQTAPVMKLNELEYINHFIYANIYGTNSIIKIDPASGKVTGLFDLTSLVNKAKSTYPASMEMNGIAYDPVSGKTYITGKMWPTLYQIQLEHQPK